MPAPMVKIEIGGRAFYVDAAVAREFEYNRGVADFHRAMNSGTATIAATQMSDSEAFQADMARRRDPSSAYGSYCQRLATAYQRAGG